MSRLKYRIIPATSMIIISKRMISRKSPSIREVSYFVYACHTLSMLQVRSKLAFDDLSP